MRKGETELSHELLKLQELFKRDMEDLMIKPLQDCMSKLEKSHEALEYKGELISAIKRENNLLKLDCNLVQKENEQLKQRINKIENKLIACNVILHGISDQVWELKEVTREKALSAISHIANGKTPEEKLNVVRKIGIRDVR